jgi:protein kinase-like protein
MDGSDALQPVGELDRAQVIGGYGLISVLGEGGCGVVYLARELGSDRLVALKVAKPDAPLAPLLFRKELKNACKLAHPHIVRVLAGGQTESGQAFLAMQLMENGTLCEALELGQFGDRRAILGLVLKLSRALEHAHRYFVLHCDLKSENILFDADGEPHLADFGLAQLTDDSDSRQPQTSGGTRGWMSPEQARNRLLPPGTEPLPLTAASDVFSLGVLLHQLLRGELPFGDGEDYEQRVQFEPAPSPVRNRRWPAELDWELTVICQGAMAKEPARRYRSAAELADDLERALNGLPIAAERSLPTRRLAKWVRRHQLLALAGVLLALFLLYLPVVPFLVLEQSRSVLIEQNSNAALYQAGAVMNELRALGDRLQRIAEDPEVPRLVEHPDLATVPPALTRHAGRYFENLIVYSADGVLHARMPKADNIPPGFDFRFRDYYQGAMRLGHEGLRQVYVARSLRSKISGQMEMELALPLFGTSGEFIGFLAGSRQLSSTFGAVQMNCAGGGNCMTELLGPRDRDVADVPVPSTISVAAAPGLASGAEITWDLTLGKKICAQLGCTPAPRDQFQTRTGIRPLVADYVDPVSHIASIGAFAPVGRTGLVVVVATPRSAVRELTDRMLRKARAYLGAPMLVGVFLFGALLASLRLYRPKAAGSRWNPGRPGLSA